MKTVCKDCKDANSDFYLSTECDHLLCLDCVTTKWDSNYSLRCCGKLTFLQEAACQAVAEMTKQKKSLADKRNSCVNAARVSCDSLLEDMKQNQQSLGKEIESKPVKGQFGSQIDMNDNGSFINDYRVSRDTDKIKDCDVPCPEKQQEELLRMVNESRKYQMEEILHSSINKLRTQFDIYHKQLEEKELKMIQEMQILFDKEVRESGSTASSIERMRSLIGNIAEQTAPQHLGIVKSGHCLAESPYSNTVPKTQSVAEPRTDKILQKLQFNQQKMKQKLNRHYQLLK